MRPSEKFGDRDIIDIEKHRMRLDRIARRELDEEEAADGVEPRVRRTAAEYAALRQPSPVMEEVLPTGPALLGGPEAAGKSLLARDWGLHVATGTPWRGHAVLETRPVLYVMDEGMHDFGDRWSASPLWESAKDNTYVITEPVNLVSTEDVRRLIDEYIDLRPGLVIFDTIYGMGMPDDMGVKEVAPVINAMKRISAEWSACTLAIGHSGHNSSERRFRGSSMWRQRTDVDWHMADLLLTCERSKIADRRRLGGRYELEYPRLRFLDALEALTEEAKRIVAIQEYRRLHPEHSKHAVATALAPQLGVHAKTITRLIDKLAEDVHRDGDQR
ncbi:AAA family ATPase [Blastococcus sp. SYSU DS0533]